METASLIIKVGFSATLGNPNKNNCQQHWLQNIPQYVGCPVVLFLVLMVTSYILNSTQWFQLLRQADDTPFEINV
jgi:hypothetical protein